MSEGVTGALRAQAKRLLEHLDIVPEQHLWDIAWTLLRHRSLLPFRGGGVAVDRDHMRDLLSALAQGGVATGLVRDTDDLVQGLKRHWLLRSAFPQPTPGEEQLKPAPLLGPPAQDAP